MGLHDVGIDKRGEPVVAEFCRAIPSTFTSSSANLLFSKYYIASACFRTLDCFHFPGLILWLSRAQ